MGMVRAVCIRVIISLLVLCGFRLVAAPTIFAAEAPRFGEVWANGSLEYGRPLGDLGLNGIFFERQSEQMLSGRLEWVSPETILPAGRQRAAYRFIPDTAGYSPYESSLEITVDTRLLQVYVTGVTTREYDGGSTAVGEGIFTDGALEGDEVDVGAIIHYHDAAAALNKPVASVDLELSGAQSGNYLPELSMQPSVGNILVL